MDGQWRRRVEYRVFVLRGGVGPECSLRRGYGVKKDSSASLSRCYWKYLEADQEQTAAVGAALPKS